MIFKRRNIVYPIKCNVREKLLHYSSSAEGSGRLNFYLNTGSGETLLANYYYFFHPKSCLCVNISVMMGGATFLLSQNKKLHNAFNRPMLKSCNHYSLDL